MIEEHLEIFDTKIRYHDKHRFEIKLDIELFSEKNSAYDVQTYFFVPRSLNISPFTYSKKEFYNDIQRYIRFKTPKISIEKIIDVQTASSPLNRIKSSLSTILTGSKDVRLINSIYNEFKLLGCIVRGELRDYARYFLNQIESINENAADNAVKSNFLDESLKTFVKDLKNLITNINSMKTTILNPNVAIKLQETFLFFDEYFSLIIEEYLTMMLESLRKCKTCMDRLKNIEKEIAHIAASQSNYRTSMNYPSVIRGSKGNETIIYRRGILKKFISSVLYLKVEISEWETLTQIFFALAAGIAMLFAILVMVYAQNRYAINSIPFIFIIVVSYIFKDRIKDWLKLFFSRGMIKWVSDRRTNILDPMSDKRIGVLKEAFSFISEGAIPPDISRIRNIDNITSIDEDGKPERVFKYEKKIALFPKKILKFHERRKDLNDIIRFNIRNFIEQADDSVVDYSYADSKTEQIMTIHCPRVYHLNVILKYIYLEADYKERIHYDRIRIVLNKEGIVRLEEVKVA